jgi:hypothetical protein
LATNGFGCTGDAIYLGALYDPYVLDDHRGPYFAHVHAKVVQQDIRDVDGNLVPPWFMKDKLRAGTVVLIIVSLHCWMITDKGNRTKKVRTADFNFSFHFKSFMLRCIKLTVIAFVFSQNPTEK